MQDGTQPPQQSGAPYGAPAPQVYIYGPPAQKKTPIMSVLSLVFGIPSVFAAWTGIGLVATVFALVFGFVGKAKEPDARGLWLTGIILGFTGLGIAILVWIILLVLGFGLFGAFNLFSTTVPSNQY
jgi:dolichol kinase